MAALESDWRIVILTNIGPPAGENSAIEVFEARSSQVQGQLLSLLRSMSKGSELLLHDHGQWSAINHASARVSRGRLVPRIVTPRGMLSPWALNHRRLKKRLAWLLYARRDIFNARVLHATSELERRELRELGVRHPIAVIPNGVTVTPDVRGRLPPDGKPYVLFLSRIHQKKGVMELLHAWRTASPTGWDLVIAGPDSDGLLANSRLDENVRYIGDVEGDQKESTLQGARLFVLPSYSENFGVVVAESLMARVPVITTHGTPWELLEREKCGWWIPMEHATLVQTLREAIATPREELAAMGARGRAVVERRFSWPQIAAQMADVYRWVLGGGPPPACIDV